MGLEWRADSYTAMSGSGSPSLGRMIGVRLDARGHPSCAKNSPASVRIVVAHLVLYLHLGPFSRQVIAAIDRRIAALDDEILDAGVIGAERAARELAATLQA